MASGSSGRVNPGSQGFRFGSDDILSSYDDYTNQDSSNGLNSDPAMTSTNSNQEFNTSRMDRSSGFPLRSYSPPEDALSQDITATVERTMKKYADNMMRFLEGISSRLSQLELYCYNLDKTIGEMRSDLTREHEEADVKLRSLDKHLQEVHRSVQILRDKQELADTQKELAKLQLVQKEPSLSSHSQQVEERVPNPVPEPKTCDNTPDTHNHQLALALPHQVTPQPQPQQAPPHQHYYTPAAAPVHVPAPALAPPQQPQPPPTQGQFMSTPPLPSQPTAVQQTQSFSQYQQQTWPPQQMQSQQLQPQVRLQSSGPYPTYSPAPPSNQPPVESLPSSMPMQPQYSGPPPAQAMQGYGYGAPPRTGAPQQQINNSSYGPQPGDGYLPSGPHTSPPPPDRYAMYESGDSGRMHYPPPQQQNHAPQGGYSSPQQQQSDGRNPGPSPPQFSRPNSAYRELMEKLMNMGFRGEHVASVIQTMEESNQPIDFNAVLDRLNVQFSGGPPPPRRW